ncbi:MAG: polysulfide reductase NrfD [Rhodospirillaceae bacterium]|nr:polysulfide reductase NrfD [Rhodospirillales bacterium]
MNSSITEILYVTREIAWLPWAVQYFFLIGLSVGCFLLSLPGLALGRAEWMKPGRLALIGALTCGLVAPVALLADLHQPGRFLNFYLHPQATSWMSWGAFFIPLYLAGLLVYAWAALYRCAGGTAVKAAALVTGLGAALVMLYTGVEVMVVAARPLWHSPFVPLQFAATALAGSIGLVLVFNRILGGGDPGAEVALNRTLARTLAAVLAIGVLWMLLALSGFSNTHSQALAQVASSPSWQLTAVWAVTATLVPLVLAWKRPAGTGVLTGLIAIHSAWMFRWTIFIGGQDIPKTGAGFYDYHLPLGPEGLLGIVGTAGLWLAVLILLTSVLPRSNPAKGV